MSKPAIAGKARPGIGQRLTSEFAKNAPPGGGDIRNDDRSIRVNQTPSRFPALLPAAIALLSATMVPHVGAQQVPAAKPGDPTPEVPYFVAPDEGWPEDVRTGKIDKVPLKGPDGEQPHDRAWYHMGVPETYTPDKAWPLFVVLHGGPRGKPGDILGYYRELLNDAGAISVYPRSLRNVLLDWNYPHSGTYLLAIIKQVASRYRIDPRRVYLTGVSMGGGGSWVQGALGRDVWAAVGPISGWYGASQSPDPELLEDIPIYFLHGTKDDRVPVILGRRARRALEGIGRKVTVFKQRPEPEKIAELDCIYREIQGGGHNCFRPWKKRGRAELELMIGWMLSHKRKRPADLDKAKARIAQHGKKFRWRPAPAPLGRYRQAKR
jgi:dienelactone hydrolase